MISTLSLVILLAQSSALPPRSAPVATDTAVIARGWSAMAEGRYTAAAADADRVLGKRPWDHRAILLKVTALSALDPAKGLDGYEGWLRSSRHEDVFLLDPVALGVLTQIASGADTGLALEALGVLTTIEPEVARAALAKHPDSETAFDPTRAALGDQPAKARVIEVLSTASSRERLVALRNLSVTAGIPAAAIAPLLADPAPPVKAAAIEFLARMGGVNAVDDIRPLMSDPDPFVQATATVALGRLGDPAAVELVRQMADSPVGDTAAMAAAVLKERGIDVSAIAQRVSADENPLTRLSAAALLPGDSELAQSILANAATDANPVIRARAAQLLAPLAVTDLATLRRLLRDVSPEVRMGAARSLVHLIRP